MQGKKNIAFALTLGIVCMCPSLAQGNLDKTVEEAPSSLMEVQTNQDSELPDDDEIESGDCQNSATYWGNSFSFKFHQPDCLFAQCMNKKHLIVFNTAQEAIAAHYAPCKYCWPPFSCEVHGVLLLPKVNNPPPAQSTSETRSDE